MYTYNYSNVLTAQLYLQEDSTHFPPDVTQGNKEEVTFYPRHPASTASSSNTSGKYFMNIVVVQLINVEHLHRF